jgi:hypothetical protein
VNLERQRSKICLERDLVRTFDGFEGGWGEQDAKDDHFLPHGWVIFVGLFSEVMDSGSEGIRSKHRGSLEGLHVGPAGPCSACSSFHSCPP